MTGTSVSADRDHTQKESNGQQWGGGKWCKVRADEKQWGVRGDGRIQQHNDDSWGLPQKMFLGLAKEIFGLENLSFSGKGTGAVKIDEHKYATLTGKQ